MRVTAETIEALKAQAQSDEARVKRPPRAKSIYGVGRNPNSLKNLVAPFKPGQSGNPGGKRRYDIAGEIARAVFEGNQEAVYQAMAKALLKGNAYVFKELAERGFGKLKEHVDVSVDSLAERLSKARARR